MSDQRHLTDEQFSEILLGGESPSVSSHLAACEACSAEAVRVRSAIGEFRQQSKVWAERRASTRPRLPESTKHAALWTGRVPAWSGAALALILAAGVGLGVYHDRTSGTSQTAQNQPASAVSQATLKADNDLLSDIDGELRVNDSMSTDTYSVTSASHTGHSQSAAKRTVTE